ncbi:MAG: nucleotidyltransferase domain-containing protein [Bacteroidales bacterium]|nr:nucleotidyltransferase domain-containing protein [Bacteroidales bacterium]
MRTTDEYIRLLRAFKDEHGAEYGITRMGIFGSVARGEQTESSDVDVYYEGQVIDLLDPRDLHGSLENLLEGRVDLVRRHNYMRPAFLERIMKEIIYV